MTVPLIVQVPIADRADLQQFLDESQLDDEIAASRPFDGEAAAQALLLITSGAFPFFRAWLRARVDARKATKVSLDGIHLSGYTATEVQNILDQVQQRLPPADAAEH